MLGFFSENFLLIGTPQKDPDFIQHVMKRVMDSVDTSKGSDNKSDIDSTDSPVPPTPAQGKFKFRRQSQQSSPQLSQKSSPQPSPQLSHQSSPQSSPHHIVGHVELVFPPGFLAKFEKETAEKEAEEQAERDRLAQVNNTSTSQATLFTTSYVPITSPISTSSSPAPSPTPDETEYLYNFVTMPSTPYIDTAEITDTDTPDTEKSKPEKKMFPTPATMYRAKSRDDGGAARLRTYRRTVKTQDVLRHEAPLLELSLVGDDDDEDDSLDNMPLQKRLATLKPKQRSPKRNTAYCDDPEDVGALYGPREGSTQFYDMFGNQLEGKHGSDYRQVIEDRLNNPINTPFDYPESEEFQVEKEIKKKQKPKKSRNTKRFDPADITENQEGCISVQLEMSNGGCGKVPKSTKGSKPSIPRKPSHLKRKVEPKAIVSGSKRRDTKLSPTSQNLLDSIDVSSMKGITIPFVDMSMAANNSLDFSAISMLNDLPSHTSSKSSDTIDDIDFSDMSDMIMLEDADLSDVSLNETDTVNIVGKLANATQKTENVTQKKR